jgi:outer membrane protein assembly factor BamB
MSVSEPRPPTVRPAAAWSNVLVWALILLLGLLFAGLTAYRVLSRNFNEQDPEKLREFSAGAPRTEEGKASGTDWPQWRGPYRDGVSTETGLFFDWPEEGPRVLWTQPAGPGYSSVVVANGCAFTMLQDGEEEAVVCWDAASGKDRWRFQYPAHLRQPYGDGPRSTPAIVGDRIYTVGGTGVVHCLRFGQFAFGGLEWRKDLRADFGGRHLEWGVSFSPFVENGLVYLMPGGPDGYALVALNQDTGAVEWHNLDDRPSYSSPIAADLAGRRQIVWLTGERLVGVAPESGKLLWEVPWDAGIGHAPTNIATPLVIHRDVGDYVFISSGYDRGCALFKIEKDGEGFRPIQVYRNRNMGTIFSTCVRQGDFLYGFDDTNLKCLELTTGRVKWKKFGFGKGSVALADGHLIVFSDHGTVAAALADPRQYREVARFEHSEQPSSWTVPVIAGGRMYIRDKTRVVCYDLQKSP